MKIIVSIILALTTTYSFAQSSLNPNSTLLQSDNPTAYRLFPTQNMWTFIKLDTRNGLLWQVQYDVKEDNRFVSNLNSERLVSNGEEANNRFTLYPTQNIYTFILLDQMNGKTWQVQWSIDAKDRFIIPIE